MNKIKYFYNQYVRAEDKILLGCLLLTTLIGLCYMLINFFGANDSGNAWVPPTYYLGLPIMVGLFLLSLYARDDLSPRMGFLTWTYCLYFFMLLGLGALVYGVQFTPFTPIDPLLVKVDQLMGFNQIATLHFTQAHHHFALFLNQCYSLIGIELGFIPLILALLMEKRAVYILFLSIIVSFIVGTAIYYFFPTTAPASVFFDRLFALQQQDTFIKFFEIHHHLPITTTEGGLVAFPSFHVTWCVLLAYAFRNKKFLLVPIMFLNAIIIISTVFLGWHYLIDVFAGFALAILSIYVAETVHSKFIAPKTAKKKAISVQRWPIMTNTLTKKANNFQ